MKAKVEQESIGRIIVESVGTKTRGRDDRTQRTSDDGVPLWVVVCLTSDADTGFADRMRVTVPGATRPELPAFAPVEFENLYVHTARFRDGTSVWWTADAVRVAA